MPWRHDSKLEAEKPQEGNSGAEIQVETGSRKAGQEFDVPVDLSFALGVPRP